jgi:hypothetical protein
LARLARLGKPTVTAKVAEAIRPKEARVTMVKLLDLLEKSR